MISVQYLLKGLNEFGNRRCKREYVGHKDLNEWKLSILKLVNKRISFYSQNTNLLPPKPKTSLRHLKLGIQEFHGTKAYDLQPLAEERSVVNDHICYSATKFAVCVTDGQDKFPTLYWLPKLHKRPYKTRFIANSNSCTTTELSNLFTSCLTAIKKHVIKYCDKVFERSGRNLFWSIKNRMRF